VAFVGAGHSPSSQSPSQQEKSYEHEGPKSDHGRLARPYSIGDKRTRAGRCPGSKLGGHSRPGDLTGRVGIAARSFRHRTFFEAIDLTASLGQKHIESFSEQKVSTDIPKSLSYNYTVE